MARGKASKYLPIIPVRLHPADLPHVEIGGLNEIELHGVGVRLAGTQRDTADVASLVRGGTLLSLRGTWVAQCEAGEVM